MKKAIGFLMLLAALTVLTATALVEDIPIDAAHFPDDNFREHVARYYDKNKDSVLSEKECDAVTSISVKGSTFYKCASLEGIAYFPQLKKLDCSSNQLTSLDVSSNSALQELNCSNNQLTSLDVGANSALKTLNCSRNQLTSLDVSAAASLQELECGENQLTSLNVSSNSALTNLSCYGNQLTSLDVSVNSALTILICGMNQLTSLDVSANTALKELSCGYSQLTSLDVSANPALEDLYCPWNQLYSLDVSANTALKKLSCYGNQSVAVTEKGRFDLSTLPGFDVTKASQWSRGTVSGTILTVPSVGSVTYIYDCGSGHSETFTLNAVGFNPEFPIDAAHFPDENFRAYVTENFDLDHNGVLSEVESVAVKRIGVESKNIASLQGIEYFPNLTTLYCSSNQLTSLDLSANPDLDWLMCTSNQLTSLNVSANPALRALGCGGNQLTSLDVSANTALTILGCEHNQLNSLDVRANTALKELTCHSNQFSGTLDVSNCTRLEELHCMNNQLTGLNVSGCTALKELSCYENQLTSLDLSSNTALQFLWFGWNQLTSIDISACAVGIGVNVAKGMADSNSLEIIAEGGRIDLSAFPGFDVTRASDWNGGTVEGTILTVPDSGKVTYTYDIGQGKSEKFTLKVTVVDILPEVSIDAAHFPDSNFRAFVSEEYDGDKNGILSGVERGIVTKIDVSEKNIASLQGIECFPKLQTLSCGSNQLTSLDVSENTALKSLSCGQNQLTRLDVNANTALTTLSCGSNQLTSLDVSGNPALYSLSCNGNQLTSLDVSGNPALERLYCYNNQRTITAENGQFDLSTLPGFDILKASNWAGGTISDMILTVPASGKVTYTYNCGNGYSEIFTLIVTVTGEPVPEILPGDVNGDGKVDGRDLLRLAKYIAGNDVEIDEKAADLTGDGKVDGRDVLRLAKTLAGV